MQKLFTNFLLAKRSLIVIAELLLVFEINKYSFKKAEKYACHKNGTPKGKILQKPDTEMIIKTAVYVSANPSFAIMLSMTQIQNTTKAALHV